MIEYTDKDVKEIGDALNTLIQKCAEAGVTSLNALYLTMAI
jgi:hypothetical protein